MSLIDEALKRAEMEAARRDGLKSGAYPWVLEQRARRRRPWGVVGAVVLVIGLLAGGAFWLSRTSVTVLRTAPGQGGESQVEGLRSKVQSPPGQELQTVEVAPPPRAQPSRVVGVEGQTEGPKASVEPKPAAPKAHAPAEASRARGAPDVPARSAAAAAESKSAGGPVEAKTYVGEVTVPDGGKIELGGIVYSETNPVALINGKVLGPGAVVEEFTIVSIQPDRVELRGRGITLFLTLK